MDHPRLIFPIVSPGRFSFLVYAKKSTLPAQILNRGRIHASRANLARSRAWPGAILLRAAFKFEQKWPVDLLDMGSAVLDGFSRVRYFDQLSRGFFWIGDRPVRVRKPPLLPRTPRAYGRGWQPHRWCIRVDDCMDRSRPARRIFIKRNAYPFRDRADAHVAVVGGLRGRDGE
jgi:hypothetical protein